MSGVIWKFKVGAELPAKIIVPQGSRVLHIKRDPGNDLCAWAIVPDTQATRVVRGVRIIGTGHPMPDGDWTYLNSWMVGPMVFHAFIEGTQP